MTTFPAATVADASAGYEFPPAGVRGVVFDVVGTLVEPAPPVAEAYLAAARRHGVDPDLEKIRRGFRDAWRRQEAFDAAAAKPFATSREREQDRWRRIVADVFDGHPAGEAIFRDLWDHFGRPDAWRELPAGRRLVRCAINARITVAIASNFDDRLFAIARELEPLSWADHVFASSEIGWRKPAAGFFRWIEERLGLAPSELLIVGDDPELDIAAGRRAGWHVHPLGRQSS